MNNPTDPQAAPEHHTQVWRKFLILLAILIGYFLYLTHEYDLVTGGAAALITWSFFVLCTPVADAGFLLDFPMRLLFGVRMITSEIFIWGMAVGLNILFLLLKPVYYDTTPITRVFKTILTTPYPYWGVIGLSAVGTFLSIKFGDELMDVIAHKNRHYFHKHAITHEIIVILALFALIFAGYFALVNELNLGDYLK